MKKLLIVALFVNAVLLAGRFWQEANADLAAGGGGGVSSCEGDPTKYSLDTNADGNVDLSDFVGGLNWFFSGGEAPRVCLATDDLEARIADLENAVDTLEATSVPDGEMRLVALEGQLPVDWGDIQNRPPGLDDGDDGLTAVGWSDIQERPSGLDDGDDVGLTSLIPPIAGFTFVETNAEGYPEYTHDTSGIRFVRLPGGSFDMGSPATETGRFDEEGPVHTVSLSPFLIAKYEVTQAEYASVMTDPPAGLSATPSGNFGSAPASDQRPVEAVSWDDLHATDGFLKRTALSLPSEAQWEYACRAGTSGPYAGNGNIDDMGWYSDNSGGSSQDVGGKQANQFGLHDMHGNVYEWCEDVYKSDFYAEDVPGFDPVSTTGSGDRVIRGGSFFFLAARFARSAYRSFIIPSSRDSSLGFRPARPLP